MHSSHFLSLFCCCCCCAFCVSYSRTTLPTIWLLLVLSGLWTKFILVLLVYVCVLFLVVFAFAMISSSCSNNNSSNKSNTNDGERKKAWYYALIRFGCVCLAWTKSFSPIFSCLAVVFALCVCVCARVCLYLFSIYDFLILSFVTSSLYTLFFTSFPLPIYYIFFRLAVFNLSIYNSLPSRSYSISLSTLEASEYNFSVPCTTHDTHTHKQSIDSY